ncbi:MAG: hypothetical protein AB7L09_02120 [Nitrospira sp.]
MPRLGAEVYAAHMDNLLKLARQEGGVSRPQLVETLNITRAVANGLIEKAGLRVVRTDGRTEYFQAPDDEPVSPESSTPAAEPEKPAKKQSTRPAAAVEVVTPTSAETGETRDVMAEIAELDAQIIGARNELREAAERAGKALGEWATHQALVDALRIRMQDLAVKRLTLSS